MKAAARMAAAGPRQPGESGATFALPGIFLLSAEQTESSPTRPMLFFFVQIKNHVTLLNKNFTENITCIHVQLKKMHVLF